MTSIIFSTKLRPNYLKAYLTLKGVRVSSFQALLERSPTTTYNIMRGKSAITAHEYYKILTKYPDIVEQDMLPDNLKFVKTGDTGHFIKGA